MTVKSSITLTINGRDHAISVEPRKTLADAIRDDCEQTGTHIGCEHGICGACTVLLDGEPVRSCLMLAVQTNGRAIRTVEALAEYGALHPLQQAFHERHALQCGFCTPGFLMSLEPLIRDADELNDAEIRDALTGNLCRCTGYLAIVEAVKIAAQKLRGNDDSG